MSLLMKPRSMAGKMAVRSRKFQMKIVKTRQAARGLHVMCFIEREAHELMPLGKGKFGIWVPEFDVVLLRK